MAHFKRKKRRWKNLGYWLPKRLRGSRFNPRPPAKKKWPCKKLKGSHDFKVEKKETYSFCADILLTYRCTACQKKYVKFITRKHGEKGGVVKP